MLYWIWFILFKSHGSHQVKSCSFDDSCEVTTTNAWSTIFSIIAFTTVVGNGLVSAEKYFKIEPLSGLEVLTFLPRRDMPFLFTLVRFIKRLHCDMFNLRVLSGHLYSVLVYWLPKPFSKSISDSLFVCRSINCLVVQIANLFDCFFSFGIFFFYSNNVQNIEARRINLFCRTGYSCRIYERLHSDTVLRWKWKSAVFRFSRRNNYPHNIKCLRKVDVYMRIGYSRKWNSMRIWHLKLR